MFLALMLPLMVCQPPAVTVSIDPTGGGMDPTFMHELPSLRYDVVCPPPVTGCSNTVTRVGVGPYYVYWASEPTTQQSFHATPYETQGSTVTGNVVLASSQDAWGCKLIAKVTAYCANAGAGTFDVPPTVVPPFVRINDRKLFGAAIYPSGSAKSVDADAVPVNTPFRLTPKFFVWPKGAEQVTVRILGAGIDFTGHYGDDPATTTTSDTHDVYDAYAKDPASLVTANATGAVKLWLEFEGTKSVEVSYTVTAAASGAGGGSGSGGGSGGGGSSHTGGGCSTGVASAPELALAVLLLLRRVRRKS